MQVRYQLRHSPIVIRHIAVLWTTTGILAGGSAGREIGSAAPLRSPHVPHTDSVRGFVFDVATGKLDEVA